MSAGDDVEPVALADDLGDVRPTERDAVEHVELAAERELACGRRLAARTRVTVRPRTATSGSALPGPHGASAGELAVERVVDVERGRAPGRSRCASRGSGGTDSAARARKRVAERVPAVRRRSRSRRRRHGRRSRMNRSAQRSRVAPRSSDPSLRHEARTTSPSSAPTTAGRPRSSARRAATRPTMPTVHGPRTTRGGFAGLRRDRARASATAVFIRSRRVRLAASRASAWVGRLDRVARRAAAGRPRAPPPPDRRR